MIPIAVVFGPLEARNLPSFSSRHSLRGATAMRSLHNPSNNLFELDQSRPRGAGGGTGGGGSGSSRGGVTVTIRPKPLGFEVTLKATGSMLDIFPSRTGTAQTLNTLKSSTSISQGFVKDVMNGELQPESRPKPPTSTGQADTERTIYTLSS